MNSPQPTPQQMAQSDASNPVHDLNGVIDHAAESLRSSFQRFFLKPAAAVVARTKPWLLLTSDQDQDENIEYHNPTLSIQQNRDSKR